MYNKTNITLFLRVMQDSMFINKSLYEPPLIQIIWNNESYFLRMDLFKC